MRTYLSTALFATIISLFMSSVGPSALAGVLDDILVAPKTLIDRAVENVFASGQVRTYDMGGTSSTADLTDAVIEKIKGSQGK